MKNALPRSTAPKSRLAFIAVLVAALALALGLIGCGGSGSSGSTQPETPAIDESVFYGNWNVASILTDSDDSTVSEELMEELAAEGIFIVFTVNSDHTCSMDIFGDVTNGTWEATGVDSAVFTMDGQAIDATISGDTLTLTQDDATMTCKRATSQSGGSQDSSSGHQKGSAADSAEPAESTEPAVPEEPPAPQLVPGWNDVDGHQVYVNDDGTKASGWLKIDKKWYFFADGVAQTGVLEDGGYRYEFDENGVMLTGWQNDGEHYHYYNPSNGKALTGWQEIDGVWYVFDERGNMRTGWYTDDKGQEFYLGNNGKMRTGWVDIEESSYYFNENGKLQKDTWIDGYYVDEWGEWVEGRQPLPSNGTVFVGGSGYSTLTVNAPSDRNVYIKLKDSGGSVSTSFFVTADSSVTVNVPGGYYYLYAAYGYDEWYGPDAKYPFGADTSFSVDDEGADYSSYSWEYTLRSVSNGNLSMDDIGADEF